MSWQERFSSKMNRSSWKTAHEDWHPTIEDGDDLQSHLMQHHSGDFIGDIDDHEWYHLDPDAYHDFHLENNFPIEDNQPDHYHANDYDHLTIPNRLPSSFAGFNKLADPTTTLRGEGISGMIDPDEEVVGPQDLDSNATNVDKFPKSVGVFNSSKIAHLGNDLSHPWPEDTQQQFVDHVLTHHNYHSRDYDDAPRSAKEYEKYLQNPLHIQEEINGHRADHEGKGGISGTHPHSHDDLTVLGSKITSSWKIAHEDKHPWPQDIDQLVNHIKSHHMPGVANHADNTFTTIRDVLNGIHNDPEWSFDTHNIIHKMNQEFHPGNIPRKPNHNHDDDLSEETSDLDHLETFLPKYITAANWNSRLGYSEFGNPIDYNENRMQSLEAPGLEIKTPLDTGKRNYSEQRQDANPLTLRSWFTGDDVNGPWPHTKNLSGPLDFEPTDNQNEDSTGPVMSSFQSRYAHDDKHPWPNTTNEAAEHMISHHEALIQHNMNKNGWTRDETISKIRANSAMINRKRTGDIMGYLDAHVGLHKNSSVVKRYPPTHNHDDDDDLDIDVPDNIDTIAPTYVTSSWHQSNAEIFDTNPDEETPDTLLNPADELKNGRPRANDLPNQSAQLIPGMLIDHDQMGGSGTASGSF